MAEALINDPRKKLYSALVSSPDKDLAGQVKRFSYNKFNSLLDNTDFVKDLFLDISERGVVLDPKNPRSSQDPNEFISAFVQKEIPQAPPAPKPQAAPVAPPPVEEEPYVPKPQPAIGSPEYDAQLQAQYGGMKPTLGATFGGAPAAFETKAQKKQEQISPAFKAQKLAFEDVPIAEEQRRAQRQFAKAMKEQQQIEQQQPKGFFEDLGKQVKRGLAQGRAVQSVNMEQLRDAARGKNLEAIPYEQIAAANKAVKEFGQTQSDIDLAAKEGWIKDAWDVVKALPGVTIESLASLGRSGIEEAIVGAGTGAAAGSIIPGLGTAAGAGLGGAASMVQSGRNLEYFGTLMQELEAKGVDITDPAKLKYGIATYGKDADKTAITRANTIAAVESFLPIAGRGAEALATRVGSKVAQKPLQAIGKGLSYEPIAGPLGGATGELAAQIASGQEIDPQAVALEAGGEGAATVAAIAKAIKSRKKPSAEPSITPESEIETVSAEELQGPGFQIAYAKTREEIPQEYRGTIAEVERPATRLGRFGPMERLFAYRVPTETIDITAPEAVTEEDIAEEIPFEEIPSEEVVVPPQEGDEDLAAFGRELEAIEQAAPVAPAEEELNIVEPDSELSQKILDNGEQVVSRLDAEKRIGDGERLFGFNEQDDSLVELSLQNLGAFPVDTIIAVRPEVIEEAPEAAPEEVVSAAPAEEVAPEVAPEAAPIKPVTETTQAISATKGDEAKKAMIKEIDSQVSEKENELIEKQKQAIQKAKDDLRAINDGDKSVIGDYVKKSGYKLITKEVIAENPKSELIKKSEGKYYNSTGASIQVKTAEQIAIDAASKKANSKPTGSKIGANQYVDAYNAIIKFSQDKITAEEAKDIIEKAGLKIPKAIEQSLKAPEVPAAPAPKGKRKAPAPKAEPAPATETKEGKKAEAKEEKVTTSEFTSEQSSEAATAFDKVKTSKGFDKKYGKGAYKALSDITKNFEDIMDKVSEKIKQDCIV